MTIEQAVTSAVEGGFKFDNHHIQKTDPKWIAEHYRDGIAAMLLNREFWQALGKNQGWIGYKRTGTVGELEYHDMESWKANWHRLIDHLAEGKDITTYFESL